VNDLATGLTDTERAAIQILMDRALMDKTKELNGMPDKLPTMRSLPSVLQKVLATVEDAAGKLVEDIEAMGDHGKSVLGRVGTEVKAARDTFEEVAKSVEEGVTTNGPPL
jgi:hypothetical protein